MLIKYETNGHLAACLSERDRPRSLRLPAKRDRAEEMSMKRLLVLATCLILASPAPAQENGRRPINIDDLFRFKRVADPQISPDGKRVAYVVGTVDLEANRSTSDIWLLSTSG